jgi:Ca-activated chloride channel family protein
MISFEHPLALALCLAPPAAAVASAIRNRKRLRLLSLPLDVWGGSPSDDAAAPWRAALAASVMLYGLAWMALAVAAAGPASEAATRTSANAGLDVVFAVDVSPSMAARDLEPTRLDAAKAFVRAYVESPEGAAGAAVGLVAFGAESALACPPTTDYAAVLDRLDAIRPGILGDGTAIGQGLASAYRQISASGSPGAIAVLLSDGEDNVGLSHPGDAARALRRYGAGLLVVGLGSRGDVPIDYVDPATGQRMSGAYRSGFDDDALSSIASSGGGEYRSASDDRGLAALVTELGSMGAEARGDTAMDGNAYRAVSSTKKPVGRSLFIAAMALATMGWALRRLAFGGLA